MQDPFFIKGITSIKTAFASKIVLLDFGIVLIYFICACSRMVVSNIHVLCFCCVFLRLVYLMLAVSLDCPFMIVHSVSSNVYFQPCGIFCFSFYYSKSNPNLIYLH